MNNISIQYLSRAESWLLISILSYFLMNGAQIFETLVIVPKWTASPPDSFQILKGKYALDFKTFWIIAHSLHEITFIAAIIFCWRIDFARNWLLILFAVHFGVRVWTLTYFAPNIIGFQKLINGDQSGAEKLTNPDRWRKLNYLRVALFIAVSLALIPLYLSVMQIKIE
ncbi:MAG: transposase [Chryseolinea sp.]